MPKKKGELSIEERLEQSIVAKEEEPYKLPSNWVWTRLGDITEKISKGTTPRGGENAYTKQGIKFLRVENIADNYELDFKNIKYITNEIHTNFLKRSILEENDLLVSIAGSLGRTAIISKEHLPLNTNQAIAFIRFLIKNKKISKYFSYFFNSPKAKSLLLEQAKVTAIPNLTLEILSKTKIPLPPLEEQKRIVEKLDSLFEKIQKIKEIIEEVKEKTTSRREAILSKTFSGELTEKWRGENHTENARELLVKINDEKLKLWEDECKKAEDEGRKKPAKPKLKTIDEMLVGAEEEPYKLPNNWVWTTWEEISDIFSSKRVLQKDWQKEGIPFYRTREIVALSKDELFSNELFISQEHYDSLSKETRMPKAGDLMVTGIGTIGICYLVKDNDCFYYKDASVLCVSKRGDIKSEYLKYLMKTPFMISQIKKNSAGTTVDSLTINKYKTYKLPLPPLEEQKEIVRVLDKVFEEENRISELISLENKIEILEKTILDRAFRGELDTGNNDDEPAIELLRRCLEGKR